MGMPGWPEFAFCTESAERKRIVLMQSSSSVWVSVVDKIFLWLFLTLPGYYPPSRYSGSRMALRVAALALLSLFLLQAREEASDTHPLLSCPAGAPLGAIDLQVRSPDRPDPLPFQSINRLSEGDTILYSPIKHGTQKRPGEVALVMVPARRDPKGDALVVTDPKSADKSAQWKVSQSMSLAVLVYGPDGLNKKKVRGFLSQDDQLIAQLADYAEKTSQTE